MRIGLDLRMLSAGGLIVHRGMGRYTRQQLREVLRIDRVNDYVLFCRQDADLAALVPEIAGAPNVSTAWLPPLANQSWRDLNRPADVLRATDELQRAVWAQDLDVFHLTTPGYLDDLVPFGLDGPLVATHYDLIPLLFPVWYLREPDQRKIYDRALRLVRGADRLVAISQYVAREATALLGIPAAHIRVAPPVADPCFRPLPAAERERLLAPLRERLGLADGFLLTVSHLHFAKNLRGLFNAYAQLSPEARRELPLVLACELHPDHVATVRGWARERGIESELVLTGFVKDEELVALYNAATLYVHASLSEGFGLPVLEALRCGAAVVAADATSLPEVVGEAGLLADPADPAALARAIEALRRDPERRRELGERALEQAAGFRSENLGRETLAAYEEAARAGRERPGKPLRLALWTPVPPQESGISDYSVELVRELVHHAEVEVFADEGILPGAEMADLAPVHLFTAFERRDRRRPFDAVLYQLGASYFHLYMDEALRHRTGVVTLHDLTWGALLYREAALWGEEEACHRALVATEGEEAAAGFAALRQGDPATLPARVEDFLNRQLLLGGVVAASQAQIVHLPGAASALARYPGARVFEFPMGVEDPRRSLPEGKNDLRQRLGIAETAFLIGTFGLADPVKRLEEVVRALERLAAELPEADPILLIVGRFPDPAFRDRLEALAAELGLGGRVRVLGRTEQRDFDLALLACDAVVNLRYPFRHQMSATLMRAIAAGRPVVISDVSSWDHFPASFCLRVAPDEREVETLAGHLAGLARDPARRQAMGEAARRFWKEHATPARMAHNYLRVLAEVTGRPVNPIEEPDKMSESAPSGNRLPYSKSFAQEDFADSALAAVAQEVVPESEPSGIAAWSAAMTVRALRELGALRPDAEILAVWAGARPEVFHLTRHVRRVLAVDRYLAPGQPALMLAAPERLASLPFERERLAVLPMDGRVLHFPDASFDAVFARLPDLATDDLASAAFEMGRVLKTGGVLTVAATLWPQVLRRNVVEASGLEPVGGLENLGQGPAFLVLRKTGVCRDNAWAKPSEALRGQVRQAEAEAAEALGRGGAVAPGSAPQDDRALDRLETLYRRWDAVRARHALDEASGGGIRGGLGFASRTAARVRDLGISWDLQRDLYRALLDHQIEVHQHLSALGREVDLTARLAAAEAEIQKLRTTGADVLGAINDMRKVEAGLQSTIDAMSTDGWNPGEFANLRDRQESLRVRQARLESDLADLRQQGAGAPAAIPLTARDFAEILIALEKDLPAGERPGAVEVSLQDVRAETLLLAARRHFGGRLSSSGSEYRSPNDLWIHVDFSAHWNRPLLLENAAARLAPGGRFVLVTASAAGEPPRHPGMVVQEDRAVPLASGGAVRVVAYSTVT